MHSALCRPITTLPLLTAKRAAYCTTPWSIAAAKKDAAAFLQHFDSEHRAALLHLLELADRAGQRWDIVHTDFLSPSLLADAMVALRGRSDIAAVPWGGYSQSERCR